MSLEPWFNLISVLRRTERNWARNKCRELWHPSGCRNEIKQYLTSIMACLAGGGSHVKHCVQQDQRCQSRHICEDIGRKEGRKEDRHARVLAAIQPRPPPHLRCAPKTSWHTSAEGSSGGTSWLQPRDLCPNHEPGKPNRKRAPPQPSSHPHTPTPTPTPTHTHTDTLTHTHTHTHKKAPNKTKRRMSARVTAGTWQAWE